MLVKRAIAIFLDTFLLNLILGLLFDQRAVWIGFIIGALYQWYFLTRKDGQTIGKMLMGIRVVTDSGRSVNDIQAIFRYIGYYLNTIPFMLGWLFAIFGRRGFHEIFSGTKVIEA